MTENIRSYYESYGDEGRLFRDKAHLSEYLTTIRYFEQLFKPNSYILDACAGTGRYSFYLADKGLGNLDELLAAFEDGSDCLWKATTPAKMEGYVKSAGLVARHSIGADGISFVLAEGSEHRWV